MKRFVLPIVVIMSGSFSSPAFSDVRELARSELRESVRLGHSMSLSRLMKVMDSKTDGKLVDVRAFDVGEIYYHVLLKKPDGRLTVAVVNARTGNFMSRNSSVVKDVILATKTKSNSNRTTNASNAGGNGNGNSRGNGNGNSGGNGNGNSGGNGNGNSGGNGGGNSGGGGGGNSGGNGKK